MNETEVYGIRVVHWPNNTITIPRHNRKAIEYLNNCCDPVEGENLRWYKRVEGALPLEDFLRIRCEFAYIVGKGPSLDSISAKCFKNLGAPVIALNDSIEKIESLQLVNPIYMLQRDLAKQSSKSIHIDYACVLVPPKAQHVYPDHRRYIFQPIDFLAANENLSSQAAIALLHAKGCKTIGMVCFDACIDGTLGNAECTVYDAPRDTSKYLGYCDLMKKSADSRDVTLEWILPEGERR